MGSLLKLYSTLEEKFDKETKELATKYDLKELERKLEETKSEILKWFIGLFISLIIFLMGWSWTLLKIAKG